MADDNMIAAQINEAVNKDKHFDDVQIRVNSSDGIVTLSGNVFDRKQKALAEKFARNTQGVVSVENQLKLVEPKFETLTELSMISSKNAPLVNDMKSILKEHPSINSQAIKIISAKRFGVFYIKGYVSDALKREEVEKTLEKLSGVRYVINDLVIDEDYLELLDARIDSKLLDIKKNKGIPSLTEKFFVDSANKRILPEVREALNRHPRLDASEIKVKAEPFQIGIFHLTGTVKTEEHKKMAEKMARNVRGVKYINNELEVKTKE